MTYRSLHLLVVLLASVCAAGCSLGHTVVRGGIAPDGESVLRQYDGNKVEIYDLRDGTALWSATLPSPYYIPRAWFSSNGRYFLLHEQQSEPDPNLCIVFETSSGVRKPCGSEFRKKYASLAALGISDDGRFIAYTQSLKDHGSEIYDTTARKVVFSDDSREFAGCFFSPDGLRVATSVLEGGTPHVEVLALTHDGWKPEARFLADGCQWIAGGLGLYTPDGISLWDGSAIRPILPVTWQGKAVRLLDSGRWATVHSASRLEIFQRRDQRAAFSKVSESTFPWRLTEDTQRIAEFSSWPDFVDYGFMTTPAVRGNRLAWVEPRGHQLFVVEIDLRTARRLTYRSLGMNEFYQHFDVHFVNPFHPGYEIVFRAYVGPRGKYVYKVDQNGIPFSFESLED